MPSLMHRPYPYLALSLAVTACGEDGRPDDSASATVASMATSLGTEPTTSDTGDSQTGTPTTTQNGGMSATMTGTDSTPDTGTRHRPERDRDRHRRDPGHQRNRHDRCRVRARPEVRRRVLRRRRAV
jgi:hypothetical protein